MNIYTLNAFTNTLRGLGDGIFTQPLILNDGVKLSLQSSQFHYSSEVNGIVKNYEVGTWEYLHELRKYYEYNATYYQATTFIRHVMVAPNVPIEVILNVIIKRGGIDKNATLAEAAESCWKCIKENVG